MGKRRVIGVLVGGIADDFTVQTCRGVMKAAQGKDVDIVIIPGKYIGRDIKETKDLIYEYQYNTLFSYADAQRCDALLITAGSIGCYADDATIMNFLSAYRDIPTILIGEKREGFINVNYDNSTGIKEGLEYLIDVLGCTKIVMVGGPDNNTDSFERKQSFFSVLKQHDIPVEDCNFIQGNLSRYQKELILKYLEQNPDVEAFCCVNDETAFGVYAAAKERGIELGKDIYVMGYDNTIQGAKAKPSLSTVMADAMVLGGKALELSLDWLDGKEVQSIVIPTQFIKRESFGKEKLKRKDAMLKRLDPANIDAYFNEFFYRYVMVENDNHLRTLFHTIMEIIIDFYSAEDLSEKTYVDGVLSKLIGAFFQMGALEYADVENLLVHVEEISQLMLEKHGSSNCIQKIFVNISNIYHSFIISEEQHQGNIFDLQNQKDYDLKMFVTQSMQFEKGNSQNYEVLLKNLDWLDIQHAVIYTYENPIIHLEQERFIVPNHIIIRAALNDGKIQVTFGQSRRRSKDIFRNNSALEGATFKVLLPLFSNEVLYGILLCDMSEKVFENGEFLANQFGVAAKMLHLLKVNEDIQNEYEKSMVVLKENNIALDALAKLDGLSGCLNRRGFMEEAANALDQHRKHNRSVLVGFVDMNNLKIINDRYGHDEGDFSIQLISRILKEVFSDGVIGRIGGDEFALLTTYTGEELPTIKNRLYRSFSDFNSESDKAYNITVSVGFYVIDKDEGTELSDALAFADEKLYIEKQSRSKVVAKENVG